MRFRIAAPQASLKALAATTCASLLAMGNAGSALAGDGDDDAGLDHVTITATRGNATLSDMPLHTTIVSSEQLDAAPARTLDQVLRTVSGMNFSGVPAAQSDPTGHQTRMRGLGNAKVLVLLDGVPVHDPFYLTTQWFKVPLSNVERIEVVRGGNSSLWGNMAVAGVVNVISREAQDDSAEVALGAGTFGTRSGALRATTTFGEHWGLTLVADQLLARGYQSTPAEYLWRFPQKGVTDSRDSNLQLTTQYHDHAGLRAFLRLGYHVQDQDINYVNGSNIQKSPDFGAGVAKHWQGGSQLTANAWSQAVNFEKYNGASCYFQASGTRCPSNTAVTPAQVNGNVLQYYTQYGSQRYRELGASTAWSQPIAGWLRELSAGADYRRLGATDHETFYNAPTVINAPQGNLASRTDGIGVQAFTGAYVQARLAPLPRTEITVSGRYDGWRGTGRNNTRTTAAGVVTGGVLADDRRTAFDPSVALRLDAGRGLALRGAAYRSFRAPGFNNTMRTFGANTPTIANPDLGPEQLRGWEAGFDWRHAGFEASATYFRYDVRNQIATFRVNNYATAPALVRTICSSGANDLALCGGSANFYTNDQDGQSHGVEVEFAWQATRAIDLTAQFSHTQANLTRRGALVTDPLHVQLAGTPWDVATLGIDLRPGAAFRLHVDARYIGRMPIDTTSVAGTVFEQHGSTVYNASANWAWSAHLDLQASLVNLAGLEYSENAYTASQPYNRTLSAPRTLNAGFRYRF